MPTAKEGSSFTPAPAGTHIARCISCISLGTQQPNSPQFMASFKILLTWELPEEPLTVEGKQMCMTVHKELGLSLGTKSNLRAMLESWRGRQFTAEELKGFAVEKVVGQPCMITIVHQQNAKGGVYAKVTAVSKLGKNMKCPPQIHPSVVYEVEMGRNPVFLSLPEWIRKKIQMCEEWAVAKPEPEAPVPPADDDEVPGVPEEDIEVPF